ncbi:MAG: DUF4232 domain-containing protein [Solirubrobacteraceae bacterium]
MHRFTSFRAGARRLLLVTVTIAAMVAAAVAHAAVTSARTAGTSACATGGLVAWLDDSNAGLGSQFFSLNFTNLSGHTCTLRGFPGVSEINLKHKQLGRAASRVAGTTVSTVILKNGQTAIAKLRIVAAESFPASQCGATTAAGFRVYAPNRSASLLIPQPISACSLSGVSYISVQAIKK